MSTWRRRGNDDEGASATLFVVSLLAFLSVAMLAVDGGLLYVSQRGQVADTDAGALAAANWMIENRCDPSTLDAAAAAAETEAEALVATNDPTTGIVTGGFDVTWDAGSDTCNPTGVVRVETARPTSLVFAPIFGYSDLQSGVQTQVRFGQLVAVEGVKPLGFCSSDAHYDEWRRFQGGTNPGYSALSGPDHPPYTGAGVVHRITIESITASTCANGDGNGNWGWIDFNGNTGGGGASEFRNNLRDGYGPGVDLGGPGAADNDCDAATATPENGCPGKQGAGGNNFNSEMNGLRCTGSTDDCPQYFAVVYDQATGNGNNVRYRLTGLVQFVLRGWSQKITGGAGNYLDVEFVDERIDDGRYGSASPDNTAPFGTTLCGGAVDNC